MRHAAPRRGARTARAATMIAALATASRGVRIVVIAPRVRTAGQGAKAWAAGESGRSRARAVQRARQAGSGAHATTTTSAAAMRPGAIARTPARTATVGAKARVEGSARVQLVRVQGGQEAGQETDLSEALGKDPARRVRAGTVRRAADAHKAPMRIVGGRFRGRTLAGPRSDAIRPTSDRLRETIFNVLDHAYGDPVAGTRVIDLFAGTGAMGLEALSRGARFALFVDEGAQARSIIRENVETLGLGGSARLFRRDATRMGPIGPMEPFSLVFCDPPYGRDLAPKALAACAGGGWLAPDALVVIEEAQGAAVMLPRSFAEIERRHYGETAVMFGRYTS